MVSFIFGPLPLPSLGGPLGLGPGVGGLSQTSQPNQSQPNNQPSHHLSERPTDLPVSQPNNQPTKQPNSQDRTINGPTKQPTDRPNIQPMNQLANLPTKQVAILASQRPRGLEASDAWRSSAAEPKQGGIYFQLSIWNACMFALRDIETSH